MRARVKAFWRAALFNLQPLHRRQAPFEALLPGAADLQKTVSAAPHRQRSRLRNERYLTLLKTSPTQFQVPDGSGPNQPAGTALRSHDKPPPDTLRAPCGNFQTHRKGQRFRSS